MKSVRFSKVVEKCGKPEVYLLMTETDPNFQKALHADKVMSLSDDSHGNGRITRCPVHQHLNPSPSGQSICSG